MFAERYASCNTEFAAISAQNAGKTYKAYMR